MVVRSYSRLGAPLEEEERSNVRASEPGSENLGGDGELVEALRDGSPGAAAALYARVEHPVTAALLQVLGRGDRDHEDLLQLALERIVVSVVRGTYQGRCSLATWASVVATRIAIDALRRRRTERGVLERDADVSFVADQRSRGPDVHADVSQRLHFLRRALAAIAPEKAETVILFEVLGHDLEEIADITGASIPAVQSRLVRGRKELRELIERYGKEST